MCRREGVLHGVFDGRYPVPITEVKVARGSASARGEADAVAVPVVRAQQKTLQFPRWLAIENQQNSPVPRHSSNSPSITARPASIRQTRWPICSTSVSWCDEKKTVVPSGAQEVHKRLKNLFRHRRVQTARGLVHDQQLRTPRHGEQ